MGKRSLTIRQEAEISRIGEDVLIQLKESGVNPVSLLAMYALGDVVGLGLLSQEEFDEEEVYNEDGFVVQKSGKDKALDLIPPKMRYDAARDLMQYIHVKPTGDPSGGGGDSGTIFYLPDNGRSDVEPPPLRFNGKTVDVDA